MKLLSSPKQYLYFFLFFVLPCCFFGTIGWAIYNAEQQRQINLESSLTAKYELDAHVVGNFNLNGNQVFVFKSNGREYCAIKNYGIVEIK